MTDAIDCAYSIEGDGPPLFMIHGIGAARDTWRFAMPVLKKHFTVISYDLRGHGTSPMPDGEFGLEELVADLEHLRAKLGIEKAHFAGHPLRGMIGLRIAGNSLIGPVDWFAATGAGARANRSMRGCGLHGSQGSQLCPARSRPGASCESDLPPCPPGCGTLSSLSANAGGKLPGAGQATLI